MAPPNILFMHSHNTGCYVQPWGHPVPTPRLQRLAEEGVTFRNAFAAAPTCSPSRAAFLTGMWAHSAGMLGLAHRGFRMPDYGPHLARQLKALGYHTAVSGVEHTAPELDAIGYDRVLSGLDTNYPDQGPAVDPAAAVVDFLRGAPQGPFFVNLGLNETHRPLHPADPDNHPAEDPRYSRAPRPLPDTPETRADFADFKASARVMDDAYGSVLRALDEAGLADDTLVFCFADHGLQFPRNMCNLTDHGTAVYLVVRGPGGFTGGRVEDALVSLIDLAPTVFEAAGVQPPAHVQGRSLGPLVRGEMPALHDEVFAEVNYHAAYEPMRCVRTERWKYIRRWDDRESVVLPNTDDTPSKTWLLEAGLEQQPRDQEMLYDLAFDPDEAHNLIAESRCAEVLVDLRARLQSWMAATDDPLLPDGVVAAPSGVRVNDPDGRSPQETPQEIP